MFRQRPKKIYPPGTFIATPTRVCAIIQLCLAFTIILWNLSEPFLGDLFRIKSNLLIYEEVIGLPDNKDNSHYFAELPKEQQTLILQAYQKNLDLLQKPFTQKLKESLETLLLKIPPFEQAWLILSIAIAIMLLKRIEGAAQVIWLLPLLTALYIVDNRWYGATPPSNPDTQLFPTEQFLIEKYHQKPLSEPIFTQQKELEAAWKSYLIAEWTPSPYKNADIDQQIKVGHFTFNTARALLLLHAQPIPTKQHPQEPIWMLSLYFLWNIFFAYTSHKKLLVTQLT